MLIQCIKNLLDQLDIRPEPQVEEDPLFSWHVHLINVNRRQPNHHEYINHSAYHPVGLKPILNSVCDEEASDYENDVSMKLETGIKLSCM